MKRFLHILAWIFFALFTIFIAFLLYAIFTPIHLKDKQIIIYDKNDQIIYQNDQSNTLDIDDVDPFILKAIVDIEDKRYYSHIGFDVLRTGKALINNLANKDIVEGGSTITQQYAKNIYLDNTQSIKRKIIEFFYALRLEMHYSKKEILEGYINSIYYGHGVYGLENAATFYFGKQVNALSISEIALLIGIPNGPSYFSPYESMENAKSKRNQILKALKQDGLINQQQYQKAKAEEIQLDTKNFQKTTRKNYYINAVLEKVEAMKFSDHQLMIHTYYDEEAQSALTSAIEQSMNGQEMQSSGIIIEPYTFNILAIQGGNNFNESNYNRALYAKRQVASTIKPLLYYLALQQGFTPSSTFSSEPTTFTLNDGSTYAPENYNKSYPYQDISMIHAISTSDNIYAVKTHLFLGMDSLVSALKQFHIQAEKNPSLALGCVNLSIYNMARIYTTFASEGLYVEPAFIASIHNGEQVLYTRDSTSKQLLDRDTTLLLNQALTSTYDSKNTLNSYPTMLSKQANVITGVKSGTSDWDTWVVGFNPYYSVGIWNGYDDNRDIKKQEFETSKKIWQSTFNTLMENKQEVWYEMSDQMIAKKVDPISGKEDSEGSIYWYLK
ncbi:MAG: penicillin-binding protein [Erysipelotrichia bacterium]|nr:penicillin-binding protein [Erysipelotrichia bacterium]NCC54726.1 penicillin-binding protein [Erysipelotrichia bacterium]